VGGSVIGEASNYDYSFYNPHNCRFYFFYDKLSFKPRVGGGVGWGVGFRIINGKELCLDSFLGCRFVVKKNLIEVTNKKDSKRVFKIEGNAKERKEQVINAVSLLESEAIESFKQFIQTFGGSSDLVVRRAWIPDNKILHDKIIDTIPSQVTFRNDVVKKVYKEQPSNVEFSDPVFAANYFKNMGLRDYVPEIHSSLVEIARIQKGFAEDALVPLTMQIKLHLEVMQEIKKGIVELSSAVRVINQSPLKVLQSRIKCLDDVFKEKEAIESLNDDEKQEFLSWMITTFGGKP
jgi:hypothetical protein